MKDKDRFLGAPATCEARTHVRLGASHRGDPHLRGQHRSDVEIGDVHMSWRERRSTEKVKSHSTQGHSHPSNQKHLEARSVLMC